MDKNKRNVPKEFRNEFLKALVADVETIKAELPWERIQSARASVTTDGRAIVKVSKLAVEGSVDRVCVWKGGPGDSAVSTIRCMDGQYFKGEVVMTASGPCFRRYDDGVPFPASGLSEHILTPK